jgi:hypothetical protein
LIELLIKKAPLDGEMKVAQSQLEEFLIAPRHPFEVTDRCGFAVHGQRLIVSVGEEIIVVLNVPEE